jgi:hypothetical protein
MGVFDNIYYDVTKRNPQPKKRNFDFLSKEEERDAYKWVKKAYPVYDWDSYVSDRIDPTKQEADYNTYWGAMNQYRYNRDRTYSGKDALDFGDAAYNPYDADDDTNTAYADYYKTFGKAPKDGAEIEQHKTRLTYKDQYDKTLAEDVAAYEKGMKPLKYQVSDRIKSEYDALAKLAQSGQNPMEYLDSAAPTIAKLHRATIQAEADRQRKLAESEEAAAPDMSDIYGTKKTTSKLDLDTLKALGYDEKTGFKFLNDGSFTMKRADDVQAMEDRNMATNMFPSLKPTMPKPRAVTPPEVQAQRTSEGRVGTAIGRGPQRPRSEIEQLRATGGPFGTRVPDWISTDYLKAAKVARDIVNLTPGMIAGRAVTTLPQELFKEGVATLQDLSQGEQATFDMPKWTFDRGFDSGQSYVGVIQDALDYNLKNGTRLGPFTTQEMQMFSDALKDPVVSTVVNVVGEANIDPLNIVGSRWFAEIVALRKAGKTAEAAELANRVVDAAQTAKAANTADTAVDAASAVSPSAMRQSRPVATRATRLADASVMPAPRQVGTIAPADLRATQRPGVVARAASSADNVAMAADDTATLTATRRPATSPVTATGDKAYDAMKAAPDGMAERGLSENIRTDAASAPDLRDSFSQDPDFYKVVGNKETLGKAQAIYDQGAQAATMRLNDLVDRMKPEAVPLAKMMARDLTEAGNVQGARQLLSGVASKLTEAGQFGQAARILRQADSETLLMTLDRQLKKLNIEGREIYGKKWKDFDLLPDELDNIGRIQPGDEAAIEKTMEGIANRIATSKDMPATVYEKLRSWRHMSMLLNPKTQARNLMGNVAMAGMRKVAARTSGAIQTAVLPKQMRTQAVKVGKEAKAAARSYFTANKADILRGASKYQEGIRLNMPQKRVFQTKGLEEVRKLTYRLLEAGDVPFYRNAFVDRLASFMEARGIKNIADVPEEALKLAIREAEEATFKDASALSNLLNKWKTPENYSNVIQKASTQVLDAVLPFTKTPINIARRGIQYSPVSVLTGLFKKGDWATKIDEIAKGLTGTGVMALGAWLASKDILTGSAPDDKDMAAYEKATGNAPFSILGKYTYDWAQPFAMPLVMGVEIYNALKDDPVKQARLEKMVQDPENTDFWSMAKKYTLAAIDALNASGGTLLDMSILQGVRKALGGENVGTTAAQTVIDYFMQYIPTFLGQIAGTIDPVQRQTYYGRTGENLFKTAGATAISKIPGASMALPAKITPFGKETVKPRPIGLRAVQQFASPGNITTPQDVGPAVDAEIRRLYSEGQNAQFPTTVETSFKFADRNITLTTEEYQTYQQTTGQLTEKLYNEIINSKDYRRVPDDEIDKKIKAMAAKRGMSVKALDTPKIRRQVTEEIRAGRLADAIAESKKAAQYKIVKARGLVRGNETPKELSKMLGVSQATAEWILNN